MVRTALVNRGSLGLLVILACSATALCFYSFVQAKPPCPPEFDVWVHDTRTIWMHSAPPPDIEAVSAVPFKEFDIAAEALDKCTHTPYAPGKVIWGPLTYDLYYMATKNGQYQKVQDPGTDAWISLSPTGDDKNKPTTKVQGAFFKTGYWMFIARIRATVDGVENTGSMSQQPVVVEVKGPDRISDAHVDLDYDKVDNGKHRVQNLSPDSSVPMNDPQLNPYADLKAIATADSKTDTDKFEVKKRTCAGKSSGPRGG